MGRSRSKKRPPSLQSLTQTAQCFLDKGYYAEALCHFRKLWLKHGEHYKTPLIDSYLGRVQQLADKSLFREAISVWEALHNLLKEVLSVDLYLSCLLAIGKHDKIEKLLSKYPGLLLDDGLKKSIATVVAPYFLTDVAPATKLFSSFKELLKQKDLILSCIEAYSLGTDEKLATLLRHISFRSPYSALALILKQAVKLEREASETVIQRFQEVNNKSYEPLIDCLRVIFNIDGLLDQLKSLDKTVLTIACDCRHWNSNKVKIISQLSRTQENPEALLNFIIDNHDQLNNKAMAQEIAFKLLVRHPKKIADYERIFAKVSPFEANRIRALHYEGSTSVDKAMSYWGKCIRILKKDKSKKQSLVLAILLRHTADLERRSHGDEYDDTVISRIEESLLYDVNHKESHDHLIRHYKRKDKKKLQTIIQRALTIYPQDFFITVEAATLAYNQKSFKKAATLMQTAIQIDPLSQSARELWVDIRLSESREQLRIDKAQTAQEALDSLLHGTIKKTHHRLLVKAISTLAQLRLKSKSAGHSWLDDEDVKENPLSACLTLLTESKWAKKAVNIGIKDLKQITTFKKEDIMLMVKLFSYYDEITVPVAYRTIAPIINKAADVPLSLKKAVALCCCFKRIKLFAFLKHFSAMYLKHYPDNPYLIFYHVFAKLAGNPSKASNKEAKLLLDTLQQSVMQNDHKIAREIDDFLSRTRKDPRILHMLDLFHNMPEELRNEVFLESMEEADYV